MNKQLLSALTGAVVGGIIATQLVEPYHKLVGGYPAHLSILPIEERVEQKYQLGRWHYPTLRLGLMLGGAFTFWFIAGGLGVYKSPEAKELWNSPE